GENKGSSVGTRMVVPPVVGDALLRVGREPEQRFRWLLEFVDRDLPDAGAIEAAYWQATVFAITAPLQSPDWDTFEKTERHERLLKTPRAVRALQQRVKRELRALATTRQTHFPLRSDEQRWLRSGDYTHVTGGDLLA